MSTLRFPFEFARAYRPAAALFGVVPATSYVEVSATELHVRFGLWSLRTGLANISNLELSGDYSYVKTAGPAHLSFTDKGVTFATNGDRGVCMSFRHPVRAIEPFGLLRHPGATVTVADPQGLVHAIEARQVSA